ncbi:MAG: gamma-glutamyl-gamma-aminobutyrate hydrolase family protein [Methylocystaceae bacterium]|nr:gamma-glutamyl-gamma-aminobutyrate hydrolase family protein [Methylocystaceae bacterium]
MQNKKPKIGYTTRTRLIQPLHWLVSLGIRLGGGVPVRLHAQSPKYEQDLDGLVIAGGTDLYPGLFDHDPKSGYDYDHARDKLELNWLEKSEKKDIPTLGVCRGAQLLNVQRGGTLHMDVEKSYENASYPNRFLAQVFFRKFINVEESSLLKKILRSSRLKVNSMHKQAIDELGDGLVVSAREDNQVVQAVEDPTRKFCMGVQFHPEALLHQEVFRNIFKQLVQCSKP